MISDFVQKLLLLPSLSLQVTIVKKVNQRDDGFQRVFSLAHRRHHSPIGFYGVQVYFGFETQQGKCDLDL